MFIGTAVTDRLDKQSEGSASFTPMQHAEDLLLNMTTEEKAMYLSCLFVHRRWSEDLTLD
jgi:hypothetical protein